MREGGGGGKSSGKERNVQTEAHESIDKYR